jgi:hypothetical protein
VGTVAVGTSVYINPIGDKMFIADNTLDSIFQYSTVSAVTTAIDEIGTNDGTYFGNPALGVDGALIHDTDTSVYFDGVDDYVEITNAEVVPTTGDFTMEAWFKPAQTATTSIIRGSDGFGAGWGANLAMGTGSAAFNIVTTVPSTVQVNCGFNDTYDITRFYHVVGVFEEGVGSYLYVNGVLKTFTASTRTTLRSSTKGLFIGATNSILPREGVIDEVATYNYTLTPVQIKSHYLAGADYYTNAILDSNPIGYWKLGEATGPVAVDEIGSNDGTYFGNPTLGFGVAIIGDTDTSVLFDGVDDYMEVPNIEVIPTTGDFSVEAWLRPQFSSGIVYRGADGFGPGWSFSIQIGNTVAATSVLLTNPGTSTVQVLISQTHSQSKFYHAVAVFKEGTGLYLYIDGVEVGFTASTATTLRSSTRGMFVGVSNPVVPRNGIADEVATYNYALNATQILNHYNTGIT